MGGDLNLKKSWHPVLMSNQRRVWEEEKKALDERKRIEQMIKERQEERQIQELQQMQEAAGGKKQIDRVNWMYSGPSDGTTGTTEEMEGYLLGKRRVDGLLKGTENKKLEKAATQDSFMALQSANTLRDTAAKVREDPMLAIKRQEQAAYEAIMNDPTRRRQLLKAAQGENTKPLKDEEEGERRRGERRHRSHRHHRDEDKRIRHRRDRRSHDRGRRDYDSPGRQRRTDWSRSPRRRSPSRSLSPYGKRSEVSRRSSWRTENDRPLRHRQQSSRSPKPASTSDSRRRRNSAGEESARRHHGSPFDERRRQSGRFVSRSPSPDFHRDDDQHRHKIARIDKSRDRTDSFGRGNRQSNGDNNNGVRKGPSHTSDAIQQEERAQKLAAMQADASQLDEDREKRLAAIAQREREDREREESARMKSAKYGGRGNFVSSLNRKAGDLDLGERMKRGRGALERERAD
ncbi:MAG: hypothetical protein M1825_004801 [Sarcosagium campestre]|nr:MAG: hypothetical protein M1825_004801 [Sarcosagium campestre]